MQMTNFHIKLSKASQNFSIYNFQGFLRILAVHQSLSVLESMIIYEQVLKMNYKETTVLIFLKSPQLTSKGQPSHPSMKTSKDSMFVYLVPTFRTPDNFFTALHSFFCVLIASGCSGGLKLQLPSSSFLSADPSKIAMMPPSQS